MVDSITLRRNTHEHTQYYKMYEFEAPPNFSDSTRKFLQNFFSISDTRPPLPGKGTDPYVEAFAPKGILKMGTNPRVSGEKDIAEVRQNMWKGVAKRRHQIEKVYVFNDSEIFLRGKVTYHDEQGASSTVRWSSNMEFDQDQKLTNYHVYIDKTPVNEND